MVTDGKIIVFGEVLFDVFGKNNRVLGGAPFNVAWHLKGLGLDPLFISRIGRDKNGQHIIRQMNEWGMSTEGMQTDEAFPTGMVTVDIIDNEPEFTILADQAYDRITINGDEDFLEGVYGGILYHGTLAVRNEQSNTSLKTLIASTKCRTFLDVNLRAPWWTAERLQESIARATWVKCNGDEFNTIGDLAGIGTGDEEEAAKQLCAKYGLELILITHGADGARIADSSGNVWLGQPLPVDRLVDTVGAGDGFSAVALMGLLQNWDMGSLLNRSIEFASCICGIHGATVRDVGFYQKHVSDWK